MAAITKRLLHLRPTFHSYSRPYSSTHRHFSSSSDRDGAPPSEPSSSLNDVRATLQNDSREPPRDSSLFSSGAPPPPSGEKFTSLYELYEKNVKSAGESSGSPPLPGAPPSGGGSIGDIKNRLAAFRAPSARATPPPPSGEKFTSLFELYEKNVKSAGESSGSPPLPGAGGGPPSSNFRQSMSSLGRMSTDSSVSRLTSSVSRLTENMKMTKDATGKLTKDATGKFGAGTGSPFSRFTKEAKHGNLNVKLLKELRPVKRKGKWFSLQEMSERLAKAKEVEDREREKRMGTPGGCYSGMINMKDNELKKQKNQNPQRISVSLSGVGAALEKKTGGPPKDHLVEKYFHPDNMSSAEKLKLELAKVRDEFKTSEFDCGSTRVQVAQLTTKIRHLESSLHKKDKHSRRGLTLMVQKRRKLLRYLRRTDWDSYCLVLEKLGLRDNPDKSITGSRNTTS